MVVARIVCNAAARHRQCAATEVADSAATVITRTAGDGNVRQVRRTTLVGNTATVAAPAAFQRAVAQVQRCTTAHRDGLTAALSAPLQLAVQRVTVEVDGHRISGWNTQRAVAKLDVCRDGDVRTVYLYRCAQFRFGSYCSLCPSRRTKGYEYEDKRIEYCSFFHFYFL